MTTTTAQTVQRSPDEKVNWARSVPFIAIHLAALGAIVTGVTLEAAVVFLVLIWSRMFFVTAGYHRYFAHRSFKTNRVFQFVLAVGAATAAQKGPLWWAGHHRNHHRFSDTDRDIHSPKKGFWWSHMGWILCSKYKTIPYDDIRDFAQYPEIRAIDKIWPVFPVIVAVATFLIAGWPGLFFGFFASTVVLWHQTYIVNSLSHVFGKRRYVTLDTSRNSAIIALLTMGEGWHNNHHYYQASVRQGFFWWEIDVSYYVLRVLSWVRLVHDLKMPPERVKAGERIKEGYVDLGMFAAHWEKARLALGSAQERAGDYAGAKRRAIEGFIESSRETADDLARLSAPPRGGSTAPAGE